jgi:subtilisin family serine protease
MQSMNTLLDLNLLHGLTTGKDVVVAVIDTGIDLSHADLMGQVLHHRNFVADSPYSGEIHGTAVAGIIAGAENDFGILGVAPQAKLLALRACAQIAMDNPEGRCLSSAIAEALDAAIVDQADIVNLSFGSFVQDDLIALLLDQGAGRGMVFIAPVGNDPQADDITFPASHPKVIAVAGFDANSGPLPNRKLATLADAVAPGSDFFSTAPHGKHNFFSGTSFSAAAIAGITALSLQNNTTQLDREYPGFTDVATWKNTVEKYLGAR